MRFEVIRKGTGPRFAASPLLLRKVLSPFRVASDIILSRGDMKMSNRGQDRNRVKAHRLARAWSQHELARRAGISRAAVSAIEIHRLVPSVAAALALARAFACKVEDLFGIESGHDDESWAWAPAVQPAPFWRA